MGASTSVSCMVAGVVSTWVIRCGQLGSWSQVSVICPDVTQPHQVAFAATARLGIIGRDDALLIADRRAIAPADLLALLLIMLSKDLAQQPNFGQAAQLLGRGDLIQRRKPLRHIPTH